MEPRSIVLTKEFAKKYFGNEDPIGKTLKIEQDTNVSVITGVMQDFLQNSHFHAKMLGPIVQQAMGIDLEQFEAAGNSYAYRLVPLADIHLHSGLRFEIEPAGNPLYVYLFLVAAIMVLVIAGINFMNMATAQSSSRSKEVGLRKVVGSRRQQLISQFLTESVVLSMMGLLVAIVLVYLLLPGYNNLIRMNLEFNLFGQSWILPVLLLFAILIGILSGGRNKGILRNLLILAVLTVSIHSYRAALANPVDCLRYK